jgi:hypothetical protein
MPRQRKKQKSPGHATVMQPVPPSACPRCQRILIAATGIAERRQDTRPHPGALALCDQCGSWNVFTDDLSLRLATDEEIEGVAPALRALALKVMGFSNRKETKQ